MAFARLGLDDLLELGHLGLVVLRVLLFAITVDSTTLDVRFQETETFCRLQLAKRFRSVFYLTRND